jgi:hypothetical protein
MNNCLTRPSIITDHDVRDYSHHVDRFRVIDGSEAVHVLKLIAVAAEVAEVLCQGGFDRKLGMRPRRATPHTRRGLRIPGSDRRFAAPRTTIA